MAVNQQRKQRKLAKKRARKKVQSKAFAVRKNGGLAQQMERAAGSPVLHCLLFDGIWKFGIGTLLVSRVLPDGRVAFANFLIDVHCLGVKNAFGNVASRSSYAERVYHPLLEKGRFNEIDPYEARQLLEGAVEYARENGFTPVAEYRKLKDILSDFDPREAPQTYEFEFGRDGKPFFFAGPYDSPRRCREIVATLDQTRGEGNYYFTIPIGGPHGEGQFAAAVDPGQFVDEEDDEFEPAG